MITNKDKGDILQMFIFCLSFLIILLAVISLKDDTRKLKAEVDELRLIFNQKFLQTMVTSDPQIRDLTYRTIGSTKNIQKFEF